MDDRRFDTLVRAMAQRQSRRSALKALLGIGSVTAVGAIVLDDVEAARRGQPATAPTARPTVPPAPPTNTMSVPTQPPPSATASCAGVVCNGGCCGGQCTATGACCPAGSTVCGPDCCPIGQATCCDNACCYGSCYGEELCCPTGRIACNGVCLPLGGCCSDADCAGTRCVQQVCVSSSPTEPPPPTVAASATPACQDPADCGVCTCGGDAGELFCPVCSGGLCEFVSVLCPEGWRCVDGTCQEITSTSTSTPAPSAPPAESATLTNTSTEPASASATTEPTETATATGTSTPSATATSSSTATSSATATRTATRVQPSMTSYMLALPDRCYVAVNLSGFPPNSRVNFSMLAMKDGLVWKFLDDQYYNDVPIDQNGNLDTIVMGPVWVEPDPRDPFAVVTVCPFAFSTVEDLQASADCLVLEAVCNPD